MQRIQLENRLIDLAVLIDELTLHCQRLKTRQYLTDQVRRSSTSAALNYAEAKSAGSDRDFAHKISIVLKELRETQVCLKIIRRIDGDAKEHSLAENESDELIRIFHATRETVYRRMNNEKKGNRSKSLPSSDNSQ